MATIKYILVLLVCVSFYFSGVTNAAELRLGTGTNCGIHYSDGAWQQSGQPSTMDKCKPGYSAEFIGNTPLPWLDYAVGYAYRRGPSVTDGVWVSDECYFSSTCDGRLYGTKEVSTTTKAVVLGLRPTWRFNGGSVFVEYGISFYTGTTKVSWDDTFGVCASSDCGGSQYHRRKGRSAQYAVGATYGPLFVQAYTSEDERGGEGISSGNRGLMAGISIKI